jgi:hypothetical protein
MPVPAERLFDPLSLGHANSLAGMAVRAPIVAPVNDFLQDAAQFSDDRAIAELGARRPKRMFHKRWPTTERWSTTERVRFRNPRKINT